MAINRGKQFESKFKSDWERCFPGDENAIIRLYDTTNGFSNVNNPCDYICFTHKKLFMIECKSHGGSSISFEAIPQYPRLLEYKGKKDVYPAIVIWFTEKDKVIWVPINTAEKIYNSGDKSIGLRHLDKHNILEIPSMKKRIFMDSDYSVLLEYCK